MKVLKVILVIVVLGFISAAGIFAWAWNDINTPVAHAMAGKPVNVALGSSTDQIIQKLESDGIIRHSQTFKLYIKLQGVGSQIQAGDYLFASPIAPTEVLQTLLAGGKAASKLTIIEGWTRWDIAKAMASISSLKLKSADEALSLMNDTSSIKDLDPTASSLEGYMFPDTYFIQSTTTAKELLESSVEHFHQVWKKDLADLANSSRRTPHDVVTVASIIETEAKLQSERPVVASVIYNRLRQNIPLSVDSTIVYASKLAGKWRNNGIVYLSDVNRNSPYNTRKVAGLPPGPVSNPGLSSLQAAIQPANTGFIYYVREPSRNDGAHNFYIDAAGFEIGVQKLRNWEKLNRGTGNARTATTSSTVPSNSRPSANLLKPIPGQQKPNSPAAAKPGSGEKPSSAAKPASAIKPSSPSAKPSPTAKPLPTAMPSPNAKPSTSAKPSPTAKPAPSKPAPASHKIESKGHAAHAPQQKKTTKSANVSQQSAAKKHLKSHHHH